MSGDRIRRRRFLRTLGIAGVAGVAGCGGSGDSTTGTTTRTPVPTVTETTTRGATRTPVPTETDTTTRTSTETTSATDTTTETPGFEITPVDHDKTVAAFYYPWYEGDEGVPGFTSDTWTKITPGDPTLGAYDSSDLAVVNQHIKWSVEHGITAWIIGGMFDEENFRFLDSEYADLVEYACLEGIPPKDTSAWANYREDAGQWFSDRFTYMTDVHFPRDNYLRLDDRPVLYVYAAANRTDRLVSGVRAARDRIEADPYLIADVDVWLEPARPGPRNGCREVAEAFDAVTTYNLYQPFVLQRREDLLDPETFVESAADRFREWSIAADEYGIDFLPSVFPGFDVTLAGKRARDWPVFERSPEFFGNLCETAVDFLDPSVNATFVTTFNEWPEYTAIEPTDEYGTTYLETVKSELATAQPDDFRPEVAPRLTFEFTRTVPPSELNDELDDDRELALAIDRLEFHPNDGDPIVEYDVGTRGEEPVFLEGAWGRESIQGRSVRWTGGEQKQLKMAVVPDAAASSRIVLRGMPQVKESLSWGQEAAIGSH